MIILVGASASGKTEITKKLIEKYSYKKLITTTTRKPRINEKNGVDYHFLSEREFIIKKNNNEFLEVTKYQNNYYGINKKDVFEDAIVILDPNGVNEVVSKIDNTFVILIETDKNIRYKRMISRRDKIEDIKKRIKSDDIIFDKNNIKKIDLIVENDYHHLDDLVEYIHTKIKERSNNE